MGSKLRIKVEIVSDKQAISPKVSEFHTYMYGIILYYLPRTIY